MASTPSLPFPLSYSSLNWKHDVYPSFHGRDIRMAFLSHILKEFRSKGIDPFIDNNIERSTSIPELVEAIRESRIALVMLSSNYVSSTWCLDELVEIIKCREELGQTVMVIFYDVDPIDIKDQTGDFGKVFRKTCKDKTEDDIKRWKQALVEVTKIAGYHVRNWNNEADMIEKIATDVSNALNNSILSMMDFDSLVGMDALPDLEKVKMIGIGKTTISRFLFNQYSKDFQHSVSNSMENFERVSVPNYSDDYSLKLQEKCMSKITNYEGLEISHLGVFKDRFKDKKVLVVLDDVDRLVQLEAMAKETSWFGPGSRIIISTQDQKLLRAGGVSHIYKVNSPSSDEAFQIFCMNAFGQNYPKDGFAELAWEVTRLVGELPLGLRVMGSYFREISNQEDWKMALPRLRTQLNGEIESVLKFSYDMLHDEDKSLFLHIACFFHDKTIGEVKGCLANSLSDLDVTNGLDVLTRKSLISLDEGRVRMHNLLIWLGRDIVRRQSIYEPGKRRFLVDVEDIIEVLNNDKGNCTSVIGINLNIEKGDIPFTSKRSFENLSNLQFLRIRGHDINQENLDSIPRKLRFLSWTNEISCFPSSFNLKFLVKLDMRDSKLMKLWEGIQPLSNLKWMDLSYSRSLIELPDLSTATNLWELNLSYCSSLAKLPASIGNAINLQKMNLHSCSSLVELPSSIGNAINLQKLDLSHCSNLVELPSSLGNAINLLELDVSNCTSLVELPPFLRYATYLQELNLRDFSSAVKFHFTKRKKTMVTPSPPSSFLSWKHHVFPTDVKNQTEYFGKVFSETFNCKTEDIGRWRQPLSEVAKITGYDSTTWDDEGAMIENIAIDVTTMLSNSIDFNGLVGVGAHMAKMAPLLRLDLDDVRSIVIWGPPGIGKTTIARVLYNQLSDGFQLSVFMDNINVRYPRLFNDYSAKLQLKSELMSQIVNQIDFKIPHLGALQDRLKNMKVLVVLDDVDNLGHLDALAKEILWFGPGSRIIITTKKEELLNACRISHIYELDFPLPGEARQIFCMYAFDQKFPVDGFVELAWKVTKLARSLPLGLRFMGSYLRGMSKQEWTKSLTRLNTSLDGDIGSLIKFTYDSAHDKELSNDGELTEKSPAKGFTKAREEFYPSKTALEGISTGFSPTVYIYCADALQYSFASHLSLDFRRKGISAPVNYSGTSDVIEGVSAFVVIFSENYLSSTSCTDKLVGVLQSPRKASQLVVPVFYDISPSDVVVQEHESADQIEWGSALQELMEIPGHQSREECSEYELVEEIVKDVYEKLFPTKQIGINSRLLEIEQLLCKQPWAIRHIGIWGMPGIGKTTLAQAFFKQIFRGYEVTCFIEHFDKAFHEKGLHRLFEEHFGEILKERPSLPWRKLSKKRTLVVLDDVRNPLVAQSFLRGFHWLGPGSLIIITSRDKKVLRLCQINHVYEVQSLNQNEALQLFSRYAFGKAIEDQNLLKLSKEVTDYANGNPSVIIVYGEELKGKTLSEMEIPFSELKLRTKDKIKDLFKSSYDTLNDIEKSIFLDIACSFNGENVEYVMRLFEGCGFFPHVGIDVLVEKCLVTISESRVKMHRIIQDFGREIINGETQHIERRRRLWEAYTIKNLLEASVHPNATCEAPLGTEEIEGIFLDASDLSFDVKPTAFKNMLNLRLLKIYYSSGLCLPKGLESLPSELRLLHWANYPLQSLPQHFFPRHLVELNMSYSQLQKLWGGTKNLKTLKIVKLCHSHHLTEIDDICKAPNIELIALQGCTNLQSFPATGQLQHLRVLNLSGCTKITSLPEVSPNIEELHLQGTGITELPESIVSLYKQAKFDRELSNFLAGFSGGSNALNDERLRSLAKVPSNQRSGKLVHLNMKDCPHLRSLPDMIDLESLKVLHLSGCSQLKDIQGFPRNLKELYLADTAVEELPQVPQSLEVLNAHGCMSLRSIPFNFKELPRHCTFSNCFALSAQFISIFYENALANVGGIAKEYKQEQQVNESLAFSFCLPSPEDKKFALNLPTGSSMILRLDPFPRSTFLGLFIFFEVAFSEDYQEATGFDVRCVRKWKDKKGVSRTLETTLSCWSPGEGVPKFQKDHLFFFCDLNLHPFSGKETDPDIFADLVIFEFFPVNKEGNSLDGSCTVTKCGVYPTKGTVDLKLVD